MAEAAPEIPPEAVGLKLHRIDSKDRLHACESVRFVKGYAGVERAIRLASVSGRAEVGGKIKDHFADVLDADDSLIETVALDANSYAALKNHWMRCKVESHDR